MDKFIDFLRIVGKKPGFFLSPDANGHCKSLSHLRTFLAGIEIGQQLQDDQRVLDAFTFWVCHRYQVPMGGLDGFGHILNRVAYNEPQAFEIFFELLEEYLQERERVGYDEIKARYLSQSEKFLQKAGDDTP
jgi:hypothetical protein